ncbi:MAG TPA: hypothetical protein ENM97_01125 [Moorella mulderi]|mgnify:CR=1 FL=1|nr:hypothetical protein [Moorella mulderi]
MFRKSSLKWWILAVLLAGLLISRGVYAGANNMAVTSAKDPWGNKGVLNYLLWTADAKLKQDAIRLQKDLGLDDHAMKRLRELGLKERQSIVKLKTEALNAEAFNAEVDAAFTEIDRETRSVLGPKYKAFREWVRDWWRQEKEYREKWLAEKLQKEAGVTPLADFQRGLVFVPQYYRDTSWQVALPDKYVKFANRGWWDDIPPEIRPKLQ